MGAMKGIDSKIKQINQIRGRYGDWKTPAPKLPRQKGDPLGNHKKRLERLLRLEIEVGEALLGRAVLSLAYGESEARKWTDQKTDS
ncbi:MAG: hypothetical protein GY875_13455, partial [Gammaproteobacteria bacterium]|nr:hypothetical protein [Gammaproteobacteria bacterium]